METFKITSVMSDSTRHAIYEYIYQGKKSVTVQDIAEQFSLHPNVARMHLTKLEDVNLISSFHEKAGKSGRPYRVYTLTNNEISVNFPPKDPNFFGQIALGCIESLGDMGKEVFETVGANIGRKQAEQRLLVDHIDSNEKETLFKSMETLLKQQGLNPKIGIDNQQIELEVYHCPFRQEAERNSEVVCSMHNEMLKQMFQTYFGDVEWTIEDSMMNGERTCKYQIIPKQGTIS
ncbi:MAG TPA: methanogen output domain 1-containing protein [Bacillota bacterium]|nr:methanogen output domain 1-containing protein [Bacillota bacterium]